MTVSTTTGRAPPYLGNGVTTAFPITFEFNDDLDIKVYVGTTLKTLTTHYTITGGEGTTGTVNFLIAPATGSTIVIFDDPPITQAVDYTANDPFPAETHESALDKLTRLVRRLGDQVKRSVRLPDFNATVTSTELPEPAPLKLFGWNADGTQIAYYSTDSIVGGVATVDWRTDLFSGDGVTTTFTLTRNPGVASNCDIAISGVTQRAGTDYTTATTTLTFTTPPPIGTNNINVRYGSALGAFSGSADDITFLASGTGAVTSNVGAKLREFVSVKDFGAFGDGSNADAAFSAAAKAAIGNVYTQGVSTTISRAATAAVYVPPGRYTLTQEIDTGGKQIIWILSGMAEIVGPNYLSGRLNIDGIRTSSDTYGTGDYGCGFAVVANAPKAQNARILELTTPAKLSKFLSRDSVGLYAENTSKAPEVNMPDAGTTYTATGAAFSTPIGVNRLRVGMIVDTKHSPKYSGFLTGWTTTSITVSAWYLVDGSEVAGTPPDGFGFYISPITKTWAGNLNVFLDDNSIVGGAGVREATGLEIGVFDTSTGTQPLSVGVDVIPLGNRSGKFAFWGRGPSVGSSYGWESTFLSWRHGLAGFKAQYGKAGSNNFHSIAQGLTAVGLKTDVGYYDYGSTVCSFFAEPDVDGYAFQMRKKNGSIDRFAVNYDGQICKFSLKPITINYASIYSMSGDVSILIYTTGASGGQTDLVDATVYPGRIVEAVNRSGGNYTIAGTNSQTIDGTITVVLANNTNKRYYSNGLNWLQLN